MATDHDIALTTARSRVVGLTTAAVVVGLASAVAAVAVTETASSWSYPGYERVPLGIAVAVAYTVTGALLVLRSSVGRLGWLMLAIGACSGFAALLTALTGAYGSAADPVVGRLMPLQSWLWAPPLWMVATVLPLLYPDGRVAAHAWRWPVRLAGAGIVTYSVGLAVSDTAFVGRYHVSNALAQPQWQQFASTCVRVGEYVLYVGVAVAVVGLVVRWRQTSGLRRRQVSLMLAAFVLGVAQAVVRATLPGTLPASVDRGIEIAAYVLVAATAGVALTKVRLFDLDVVLRRTVVGVAVTATVVACYVGAMTLLAVVLPGAAVPGSALGTGLAGAVIFPVTLVLTRWVRRFAWGRTINLVEVATGLGQRMRDRLDPAEIPTVVCEEIVRALRLSTARLELSTTEGTRVLAQVGPGVRVPVAGNGHRDDRDVTFNLWYRGERVGRLVVCPQDARPRLDETVTQALSSLADQVAPVVATLRLDEQLLHTREQLVTAREEERSRLSRELHDNVGPTLAGIRLQLDTVRTTLPAGFAGTELVDRAVRGIQDALATLRRVVHDLRPPELDTLGLTGAIRELAAFLSGPTLRVETTLPDDVSVLSKPVEVAAYRIVAEALTNVVRHAEASRAEVTVEITGGQLVVRISDDGIGVRPNTNRHGLGLRFMAQRVAEIAGEFSYRGDDTGTTVRAAFPIG